MEKTITPLSTIVEAKPNSFIYEKRHALPAEACDEMIRRFEQYKDEQYKGRIGQLANEDLSIKKSTDLVVSGKEHWKDVDRALFHSLGMAIKEFRETFTYFKGPFKDMGYAIQRTDPGEHYHWHIDGGSHDFSQRQLVRLACKSAHVLSRPPRAMRAAATAPRCWQRKNPTRSYRIP